MQVQGAAYTMRHIPISINDRKLKDKITKNFLWAETQKVTEVQQGSKHCDLIIYIQIKYSTERFSSAADEDFSSGIAHRSFRKTCYGTDVCFF